MSHSLGVRGRLILAFFGVSAFVVLAAAAAIYSFLKVGGELDRITQERVPAALASLELSRQAEQIVAIAPTLLTATTAAQHQQVSGTVAAQVDRLKGLLAELENEDPAAAALAAIAPSVKGLQTNLAALETGISDRLAATERKRELLRRLADTHLATQRLLAPGLLVFDARVALLGKAIETPGGSPADRPAAIEAVIKSALTSAPLRNAQLAVGTINGALLTAASSESVTDLPILRFPLRRSLRDFRDLAMSVESTLRPRLLARLDEYESFVEGPNSVIDAREHELTLIADGELLLAENAVLSGRLTEAVDRLVDGAKHDIGIANLDALSVQGTSTVVLVAVVAMSLTSSALIVWLYVGRNVIARLTGLSDSMTSIAAGDLEANIPAGGDDEIGYMAEALAVFRDTAIEVKKTNLREIREARSRLIDAIETVSEGFVLYGPDDRLVVANSRFKDLLYHDADVSIEPGMSFETIIRRAAEKGYIKDATGRVDDWLAERLARHADPRGTHLHERGDGRWIQVNERKTQDGGTVAVYSDITELKRAEQAAADARALLTDAIDHISEGFVLYGSDDRLVLCNKTFRDIWGYSETEAAPGVHWDELDRLDVERGTAIDEESGSEAYEQRRVEWRQQRQRSIEVQFTDGRWLTIRDRKTDAGGSVSIQTDITELKRAEAELIDAKQRAEEANKSVTEKNRMLESLSNQLSKYLSPQVYASIFSGEQSVEIASKRKKLTIFFSDIADFTGTTDNLESEELTNLLNHYLTEMSKVALEHGATIDKYVGDAIIAFFGDPESRGAKADAIACVEMAIAMQRRLRDLQSEWLDMGLERPFQVRMGINTGFCTVGNFGSEDRMDYTIIGNEVNLAARLEARAEIGGILLAHKTHALVKDRVLAEEGETLTVKGFAKPVRTYKVVGLYDDLEQQGRIIHHDQDGLALKIDRDKLTKQGRAEAVKAIKEVLSQLES
jgi:PAS domain S-box-containing protein